MLKYQFPAVKGCQAGKDYYICMVPLGLMSKIFVTDSSDVPAEYRAQSILTVSMIGAWKVQKPGSNTSKKWFARFLLFDIATL